jgi:hypothetical protein
MRIQTSLALLALTLLGSCYGLPKAGFTPRFLSMDIEGDISVSTVVATGAADFESLGLQKDSGSFAPRADFEWGAFELTLANSSTNHSGSGVINEELDFGGVVIPSGAVQTDFELGLTELIMTWDVIPGDSVDVGIGFGVTLADVDMNIASLDFSGIEYSTEEALPIPMLAGRLGLELGDFNFEALVAGLSVDVEGNSVTVTDMDVALRYNLIDLGGEVMGAISAGWRSFDLDYDEDTGEAEDINIGFSGPYIGISFWI